MTEEERINQTLAKKISDLDQEIKRLQEEKETLRNENIALRVASHLPEEKQQWAYDTLMGICVRKGGANG